MRTVVAGVVIVLAVLAVVIGISNPAAVLPGTGNMNDTAGDVPSDGKKGYTTVIDCRNSTATCGTTNITERIEDCNPYWSPWEPRSRLNCSYTNEGLDSVSLITDAGNYVTAPLTNSSYTTTYIGSTGEEPWDLEFLPDGGMLWTNRNGMLKHRDGDGVRTVKEFNVTTKFWNGLLGLAVDPDFERNRYVYVFYTYRIVGEPDYAVLPRLVQNRVSRFRFVNGSLADEETVMEVSGLARGSGGRLEIGPDGKLYLSATEPALYREMRNPELPGAKVLRVNRDGSIPQDNPYNGSAVYSMGHRNTQGLAWHPGTSALYATEHGEARYDEINRIEPGRSYGWAGYRCGERRPENVPSPDPSAYNDSFSNTPPAYCFDGWTLAPSGATFVDDPDHPWYGDLFVAGLRGKQVFRLRFDGGEIDGGEVFYVSHREEDVSLRMRDVEFFDGSLYAVGDDEGIVRMEPR